ncbi:DNA-binding MarR family transcriptional regulator [Murinocardiopsis flavida]|uniref:DNA-binding MarR family transcriptional regulator n=2 Tax=Murinocardiopsis flavida TaxID=645275 RepID=A0A2P8DKK6_9ACTN|nr:DNA-binding MarR family transcriptional regulator [Murinocardiopsis flavida]
MRDLVLLMRQATADQPVTAQQLAILGSLEHGPRRVGALAEEHGVRTPTMTAHLGRMAEAGLLTRTADSADARAVDIGLSEQGRRLLVEVRAVRAARLAERLDALSAAERAAIARALPAFAELCEPGPADAVGARVPGG